MSVDDAWIEAERAHERKMADIKGRERERDRLRRHETAGWLIVAVSTVAVVGILAGLVWWLVGNSTAANTERDRACNESGGTRVTITNGPVLCVHVAEVPQ